MIKKLLTTVLSAGIALAGLAAEPKTYEIDITVAADGSGDYTTITDALRKMRGGMEYNTRIFIKNGVYTEKIVMGISLCNIDIVGENADSVIIQYGDYASLNNMGTSGSYTFKIESSNISFSDITFANTAGPVGQAVAVYTTGDRISFTRCRFLGNQDTLYTGGVDKRLYFDNCYIEGTTDFIFGSATALFVNCDIHAKADSYITAASTPANVRLGYVFDRCRITAAEGVTKVYLGRPWRPYASTFFIGCEMCGAILPAGWHNWGNASNELTARYGQYDCTGEGADTSHRVTWSKILTPDEARQYVTPEYIFEISNTWNPLK
ncbi:MAG: pectin esterase [Bacteroides sp.]|nr:pectin esterase [Bacteroides sp.]